jgi:PPP family 3-phenylpropionic acid transporter
MNSATSNRPITLLKVFYFLFFAAAAALAPFLALYYEQLGSTGRQIGVLTAIPPIVTMIAASLWSGLADATQQHHRLLILAIIGAMFFALAISFAVSFWLLALLVVMFAFFTAPIIPLVDNAAMETLGERKNQYGKLRLWGAVGWGVSAPFVGLLVEQFSPSWSFYGYIGFMFAGLLLVFGLPIGHAGIGQAFWRGFGALMGNRRWLFFLVIIFIAGIGSSMTHNYLFLYMNQLGASTTVMGLALTVATLSELAVYAFSDKMLDRWGTRKMLAISIIAMIVRMLTYSVIMLPWMVLIIQLLHGLAFSVQWVAGVAYANKIAPPGMGATAQGIFSGVSMGLAAAVGAFIGGWLYESVGPFLMYRWAALGIAAALLLVGLVGRFVPDSKPALAES